MKTIQAQPTQSPPKVAIIVSNFNLDITKELLSGGLSYLENHNIPSTNIQVIHVPGAIEIPLIAQKLAKRHHYHAIICFGAIIRGETTHYDLVCNQVSHGCQQVMLTYETPIVFGILTTENSKQAYDRLGGQHGHKGKDAAKTALAMISISQQINETTPLKTQEV